VSSRDWGPTALQRHQVEKFTSPRILRPGGQANSTRGPLGTSGDTPADRGTTGRLLMRVKKKGTSEEIQTVEKAFWSVKKTGTKFKVLPVSFPPNFREYDTGREKGARSRRYVRCAPSTEVTHIVRDTNRQRLRSKVPPKGRPEKGVQNRRSSKKLGLPILVIREAIQICGVASANLWLSGC